MNTYCVSLALLICLSGVVCADWQPLWPEGIPGSPHPAQVEESVGKGGRYTNTSVPAYWYYPAKTEKRNGAAVVILPGGGYTFVSMNHEGHAYAQWLNERGIAAVVVKYRVSGKDEAGFQYPVPLLDARRTLRMTRENAEKWGIDPNKLGVMGSSAGGHLASMCLTLFDEVYEAEGEDQVISCRPDFGILVYPVIGMDQDWGHKGSRRRLLGPDHSDALAQQVASYRRVTKKTPPCFLVHAADDTVVPVRNSLEFANACAAKGVPVVLQITSTGGHGFGLSGRGDAAKWPKLLEGWLESIGNM